MPIPSNLERYTQSIPSELQEAAYVYACREAKTWLYSGSPYKVMVELLFATAASAGAGGLAVWWLAMLLKDWKWVLL